MRPERRCHCGSRPWWRILWGIWRRRWTRTSRTASWRRGRWTAIWKSGRGRLLSGRRLGKRTSVEGRWDFHLGCRRLSLLGFCRYVGGRKECWVHVLVIGVVVCDRQNLQSKKHGWKLRERIWRRRRVCWWELPLVWIIRMEHWRSQSAVKSIVACVFLKLRNDANLALVHRVMWVRRSVDLQATCVQYCFGHLRGREELRQGPYGIKLSRLSPSGICSSDLTVVSRCCSLSSQRQSLQWLRFGKLYVQSGKENGSTRGHDSSLFSAPWEVGVVMSGAKLKFGGYLDLTKSGEELSKVTSRLWIQWAFVISLLVWDV